MADPWMIDGDSVRFGLADIYSGSAERVFVVHIESWQGRMLNPGHDLLYTVVWEGEREGRQEGTFYFQSILDLNAT